MTALFLIFALTTSALVYRGTLQWLRAHPYISTLRLQTAIFGAFLIMSVLCVWIGHSLGRIHYQP
jgi:hypothetical protein